MTNKHEVPNNINQIVGEIIGKVADNKYTMTVRPVPEGVQITGFNEDGAVGFSTTMENEKRSAMRAAVLMLAVLQEVEDAEKEERGTDPEDRSGEGTVS